MAVLKSAGNPAERSRSIRSGLDLEPDALDAHLRLALAGYKTPRVYLPVTEVARSASGKPDYRWARTVANTGPGTVEA